MNVGRGPSRGASESTDVEEGGRVRLDVRVRVRRVFVAWLYLARSRRGALEEEVFVRGTRRFLQQWTAVRRWQRLAARWKRFRAVRDVAAGDANYVPPRGTLGVCAG